MLRLEKFYLLTVDTDNVKGNEVSSCSFHPEVTGIIDVILSVIEIIHYDGFIV